MKRLFLMILVALPLIMWCASFSYGMELFEDGFYEEAVAEFEQLIADYPTSREAESALFQIGESYRLQEKYEQAAVAYSRLIRAYPNNDQPDRNQYFLGLMYYEQQKYNQAIEEFAGLIKSYPNSSFSRKGLAAYVNCYFVNGDYKMTIQQGERLAADYKGSEEAAELLLLVAKASFAGDNAGKGRKVLEQINTEYPDSDVRWQVVLLQAELIETESGIMAAIKQLEEQLAANVPRAYEKPIRQKLTDYFLQNENYLSAMEQLEILVTKYDMAEDLDAMILQYQSTALTLAQYEKLATTRDAYGKMFKDNLLAGEFYLNIARGCYYQGKYDDAKLQLEQAYAMEQTDNIIGHSKYLEGQIAEQQGKYREAVKYWQESLPHQPINAPNILIETGDVYRERFDNLNAALNFYRQVQTNYSDLALQAEASYKMALCYEALGDELEAMRQLNSINAEKLSNERLQNQIEQKREYLQRYQVKDYEKGFEELLSALSDYLDNSSRALLQQRIAEILAYDLKKYEKGATLLNETSPETSYRKALLLLRLAEKYNFEQRENERDASLLQVNSIIYRLEGVLSPARRDELKIKKLLLAEGRNAANIAMMNAYIMSYEDGVARNEFLLELADIYAESGDNEKLRQVWEQLAMDDRIEAKTYFASKLKLAESYYIEGFQSQALGLYELARNEITISQPEIWYHYARAEYEQHSTAEALKRLQFLVDNVPGFRSADEAITFLASALRQQALHEEAIKYAQYLPVQQRDEAFWLALADDYMQLEQKENAKLSLMRIESKNDSTLLQLADLQYETGDMTMALYSYGVLHEKGLRTLRIFVRSGDIYYDMEEFQKAIEQYELYMEDAGADETDFSRIATRRVVCYYETAHRKQAEDIAKGYKKILNEEELKEIKLAEAKYYSTVEPDKAVKLFAKLFKEGGLSADQMIRSYFWRGLMHLNVKNIESAKSDFETVAGAKDQGFANQARFKLALIKFSEEDFTAALDDYYYVIEHDKDGDLALSAARNFAKVCRTIEEWDKAISAYEIILDKWGDSELEGKTIFDIAYCYYRDKSYQKAIDMFRKSVEQLNDAELQAEAQYWIGESYFGMDEYDKAAVELLKVVYSYDMYPQWAASADLRAGECYLRLNDAGKAKRIYERVIKKYGAGSQWGSEAGRRLGEIK